MAFDKCLHGYFTRQHCPWCHGFDDSTRDVVTVTGHGNGWLLRKDEAVCESCGGPSGAGWGITSDVALSAEPPKLCYPCRSGENTREAIDRRDRHERARGIKKPRGS